MPEPYCRECRGTCELNGDACPACYRAALRKLERIERRGAPCGMCQTLVWPRGAYQPRYCSPSCAERAAVVRRRASRRPRVLRQTRHTSTLACSRCAHQVVSAVSETGWECGLSRMLVCKPHLPGAKPYAPRLGRIAQ